MVHHGHGRADKSGEHTAPAPCISIRDRLEGGTQRKPDVERDKQRTEHVGQNLAVVGVPEVRNEEQTAERRGPVAVGNGGEQAENEPHAHGEQHERGFCFIALMGENTRKTEAHLDGDDQTNKGRVRSAVEVREVVKDALRCSGE